MSDVFTADQAAEVRRLVDSEVQRKMGNYVMRGHRHDGMDGERIKISELSPDGKCRGTLPFNYKYGGQTGISVGLTGTFADIQTVTLTPRSSSNVLIMGWCTVRNDANAIRQVIIRITNGSTQLAWAFEDLPAAILYDATVSLFVLNAPASYTEQTYNLQGYSSPNGPTVVECGLIAVEMPLALSGTN